MIEVTDWLRRCSERMRALADSSEREGFDADEIADDLFKILHNLAPEWAAETYVGTR